MADTDFPIQEHTIPPIKVLYGQPTPEELAAVVLVVHTRATTTAADPEPPRRPPVSAWTDRGTAIALRRLPVPRPA
ncbi:acyl-CoA carboxylase epsilon subunit-like protein [Streptomyces sp. SLBN-118]|uniref:acyl-CoA carboxylase subunit epsilon n=1 Tax=Streptomyces sp. SLBN-118 TaxID=2768454 RepID=UPI00116A8404|nr:acyl-CoA carboxylase subunit epsilon [Streptomyces sp. SLBN-118]TQK43041.1 acyl-CoA carboxylase epsilon subunit-like protein [Streptomyces sp. SLBN-118]